MRRACVQTSHVASIAVLALIGVVDPVRAQAVAPTDTNACVAAIGPDVGPSSPDSALRGRSDRATVGRADSVQHTTVALFAAVQAQEVRFGRPPKICVKLRGDVRLDSVRVVGRRNITSPVVTGTTYRDVYVAVEILGRLNAECISARITGTAAGTGASGACASLGLRDSASVRRVPQGTPP